MIWSLKYRPKKLCEYISNRTQLETASKWIKKISKEYKPLIITGDNGVGKTTLANLILERNNYYVINIDYDHLCDRSSIKIKLDQYLNSNTLDMLMFHRKQKKALIFDDIDCVCDKFIYKDIVTIIKKKLKKKGIKLPIIFTCKDIKKLKDIRKLCLEIKIYPPSKMTLFKYGKRIIDNEKLLIDDSALNYFIKHSQNDYRKLSNMIYYVQLVIKSEHFEKDEITIEDSISVIGNILEKNKIMNIYEISNITLNTYSNITNMINLCETEKTLSGLMMHENYIPTIVDNRKGNTKKKLGVLCKISENLSLGDIFRTSVIIDKIGWHLDTYCVFQENVFPSYILNKKIDKYAYNKVNNINFTKLLSNNTQTFNNYKIICSNKMLKTLENDNNIVIKMILDGLFSEHNNEEMVFGLIYKYKINLDIIDKFIH